MPELPEVEAARRQLARVMRGARVVRVDVHCAGLRRPFPADFARRLEGQTIRSIERRGKYLFARLSSGDTLLVHLGMSGSFRAAKSRAGMANSGRREPHDHVVFELSNGQVVTFNDPRRFGLMDVVSHDGTRDYGALRALGPEPLGPEFDARFLARACAGRRIALKVALLDQRVAAGLGNIYASEALHVAGLSPKRRAGSLAYPSGAARESAVRLVGAIKAVLRRAIARKGRQYRAGAFRVYEREGERCRRRGCGGRIRRIRQAGRSTFYCPVCQR